jgi:ABC-type multidrug transport system fused ATPase/permease subunit
MTKKLEKFVDAKPKQKTFAAAWKILPKQHQFKTFFILTLTLIGTILETAGIGMVIPAIALMADENITKKYTILIPFFSALGNPSHAQLVTYGMSLLLGVYVVKALYLAFLSWKQAQYIFDIKAYLSQKLFYQYVRSPYEFHLQQNTGHLIRNITLEVQELVIRVLIPLVLLTTEITVILAIALLLLFIEPIGALLLFTVMGLAIYVFQRITENHLNIWGAERQMHEGYRIQKAQEGLGGIKDVQLLGRESSFIEMYGTHTLNSALVERKQNALSNIPRLWLETVGVLGLTLLVIATLQHTDTPADVIPVIGLFAAAAFRVLPSANRVLSSLQSLKYADAVVGLILKELALKTEVPDDSGRKVLFNSQIHLRDVSYTYPKAATPSLSNISLTINKGESIGLVGTSGAGKSTLVDLILGLIKPSSGGIFVDNADVNQGMRSWQNLIGYVQQSIFLTDDTLRKNIAFGLKDHEIDESLIKQAIKASQLDMFVDQLPDGLETFVGERGIRLSGGQRQRIGIARALYSNPPVLVFDEATSALDNDTEAEVMESIKALKGARTMIIIAHRLSTIEHCDKVFRLEGGQLVST